MAFRRHGIVLMENGSHNCLICDFAFNSWGVVTFALIRFGTRLARGVTSGNPEHRVQGGVESYFRTTF